MRQDIAECVFMETKNDGKINCAEISRRFNCDPRTVKRYFENRNGTPRVRKKRVITPLVNGFEDIINEKMEASAPVIAIYQFIAKKGYKGSYSTLKRYCKTVKKDKIKEATMRFETMPGCQAQIDWKEKLRLHKKNGEEVLVDIFLCVLGFSRYKFIKLTLDMGQTTLFKCLMSTYNYFGGFPKEFLFDNMKTVIDRSRTQFTKPVFNNVFYNFAKDMNFKPLCCIAYRPETKGKVETVAKIMNRLKVYDYEFETLDELNKIVNELMEEINNEVCAATKQKPSILFNKIEKEHLNSSLNTNTLNSYITLKPIERKVTKEALISWAGSKYSVPIKYIGKTLICKSDNFVLYIYDKDVCISQHDLSEKPINYNAEHYKELVSQTFTDTDLINKICSENLKIYDSIGENHVQLY
jgi:Transposase and inactivated derivatives